MTIRTSGDVYIPTPKEAFEDAKISIDHCRRGIGNPIVMIGVILEQIDEGYFSLEALGTSAQEILGIVGRYAKGEEKKLAEKRKALKRNNLELSITLNAL
jgi:hypothetical protein